MNKICAYLLTMIFLFQTQNLCAQNNIDSLEILLKNTLQDTNRVILLNKIGDQITRKDPNKANKYGFEAYKLSEKLNYINGLVLSSHLLGYSFLVLSDYKNAKFYFEKEYALAKKYKNVKGISNAYMGIGTVYRIQTRYELALDYFLKAAVIEEQIADERRIAKTYINISAVYSEMKRNIMALEFLKKSLAICEKNKDKRNLSVIYNNLALIYESDKNYELATEYYTKSIQYKKEIGDNIGLAIALGNIGLIYYKEKKYEKALNNLNQALNYQIELGDRAGQAINNGNIAKIYLAQKKYVLSLEYLNKSMAIATEINLKTTQMQLHLDYSEFYEVQQNYKKSLEYLRKYIQLSDTIYSQINNQTINELQAKFDGANKEQQIVLLNKDKKLREIDLKKEKMKKNFFIFGFAFVILLLLFATYMYLYIRKVNRQLSLKNAEIMHQKEELITQAEQLEDYNKELVKLSLVANETDNAIIIFDENYILEWANPSFTRLYGYTLKEFKEKYGSHLLEATNNPSLLTIIGECLQEKKPIIYDSLVTTKSNEKKWIQTTLSPILDDNGKIIKIIAIDADIQKLKIAEQEIIQKSEEILVQKEILVLQNEEILKQRDKLKQYTDDIRASIRYALTIQQVILPVSELLDDAFENFVIYKPKDIVSGDFYWFARIKNNKNQTDKIYIAVVDCTGHGVPGAFMSLIGSRLMNEIVMEKNIHDPSEILENLNFEIKKSLQQEKTDNNDGMDICLCMIEKMEDNKTNIVFAGANRPLFYYKMVNNELLTVKGDKKVIGGARAVFQEIPFTNRQFYLHAGDCMYLTSDGIIDQNDFSGKRFGSRRFRELIASVGNLTMLEQKNKLEKELENHQRFVEQRDDITLIGIRF